MTLEDAFLRAILETPDDDLPRLAYADWLEEHDDPRGEFIHVQCRLAGMDAEDVERFELEEREDELLRLHQDDWLGALRPLLRYWTFARGFLDTIWVPVGVYLAEGEIARPATVRRMEVDLTGFDVPISVVEFMPESVARENILYPLAFDQTRFVVAMTNPNDEALIDKLEFIFIREVKAVAAPVGQIVAAIKRAYGPEPFGGVPESDTTEDMLAVMESVDDAGWDSAGSAARVVQLLLAEAVAVRGAELGLEFRPDRIRLRYGASNEWIEGAVPSRFAGGILSRMKLLAGIASTEEGDQQGHVSWVANGWNFSLEVVLRVAGDVKTILVRVVSSRPDVPSGVRE